MTELVDLDLEPGNYDNYIMNCQIFSAFEGKFYKFMNDLNIIISSQVWAGIPVPVYFPMGTL